VAPRANIRSPTDSISSKLKQVLQEFGRLNSREFLGIIDERGPLSAEVPFFVPKPLIQGDAYAQAQCEEQGRKLVACCIDNLPEGEEILSLSEPFVVPVTFRGEFMELPLIGEFDLTVRKAGLPVIVDWKTSGTRWSASQADKSLQATIYTYAWHQKSGINPEVRFDVTVKNKTPVFEQHATTRTPESWERLALLVNKAEQIVKHDCFYPAETGFYCGDCAFCAACKAWHRENGDQKSAEKVAA
jgi:Holliday junction resolvase-like predicted endonuclease